MDLGSVRFGWGLFDLMQTTKKKVELQAWPDIFHRQHFASIWVNFKWNHFNGICCRLLVDTFGWKCRFIHYAGHYKYTTLHGFAFLDQISIFSLSIFLWKWLMNFFHSLSLSTLITVLWPLWIAFGQWMLYNDESGKEIRFRIDFGYIIDPAFFIVSLYVGIILQCVFPRSKSPILPLLKSMSSYYLLFYFVLLFFCLPGSTTVNVSWIEKLLNIKIDAVRICFTFYSWQFSMEISIFSFSMLASFYRLSDIVLDGF